jgi:hypothetical protein
VTYESASQFSCEHSRRLNVPPKPFSDQVSRLSRRLVEHRQLGRSTSVSPLPKSNHNFLERASEERLPWCSSSFILAQPDVCYKAPCSPALCSSAADSSRSSSSLPCLYRNSPTHSNQAAFAAEAPGTVLARLVAPKSSQSSRNPSGSSPDSARSQRQECNPRRLREMLRKAATAPGSASREFPGLNHEYMAGTGSGSEAFTPGQVAAPLLDTIALWVNTTY